VSPGGRHASRASRPSPSATRRAARSGSRPSSAAVSRPSRPTASSGSGPPAPAARSTSSRLADPRHALARAARRSRACRRGRVPLLPAIAPGPFAPRLGASADARPFQADYDCSSPASTRRRSSSPARRSRSRRIRRSIATQTSGASGAGRDAPSRGGRSPRPTEAVAATTGAPLLVWRGATDENARHRRRQRDAPPSKAPPVRPARRLTPLAASHLPPAIRGDAPRRGPACANRPLARASSNRRGARQRAAPAALASRADRASAASRPPARRDDRAPPPHRGPSGPRHRDPARDLPDRAPHMSRSGFSPGGSASFSTAIAAQRGRARRLLPTENDDLRLGADLSGGERFRGALWASSRSGSELTDAEVAAESSARLDRVRAAPPVDACASARASSPLETPRRSSRSLPTGARSSVRIRARRATARRRRRGGATHAPRRFASRAERCSTARRRPQAADGGRRTVELLPSSPFAAHPQLESFVLAEHAPAAPALPLYADVGVD